MVVVVYHSDHRNIFTSFGSESAFISFVTIAPLSLAVALFKECFRQLQFFDISFIQLSMAISQQRRFVHRIAVHQRTRMMGRRMPFRHGIDVTAQPKNIPFSPPFDLKIEDFADVWTAIQPPMPKWMRDGFRIEGLHISDQNFQALISEFIGKYGRNNAVHDYALLWNSVVGSDFRVFFTLDQNRHPTGCSSIALLPEVAHWSICCPEAHAYTEHHQLGRALAERAMAEAGERPVFGYGSADAWFKHAREYGLRHLLDWRLWEMSVSCADVRPERLDNDASVEMADWRRVPFHQILAFDRLQTAGIDRTAYLQGTLRRSHSVARVAVCKNTNEVVGICQARQLTNRRIGISLFYADRSSIACALLRHVLLLFAGPDPSVNFDSLLFKTPSTNSDSVRLLHQLVENGKISHQREHFSLI